MHPECADATARMLSNDYIDIGAGAGSVTAIDSNGQGSRER